MYTENLIDELILSVGVIASITCYIGSYSHCSLMNRKQKA